MGEGLEEHRYVTAPGALADEQDVGAVPSEEATPHGPQDLLLLLHRGEALLCSLPHDEDPLRCHTQERPDVAPGGLGGDDHGVGLAGAVPVETAVCLPIPP